MTETRNVAAVPQRRHGANIGQPLTRRDGLLKVTGQARYAADDHSPGMLHAVLAVSSIARGRVIFLDVAAAKAHPGVVEVMTPTNRPPLALDPDAKLDPFMFRLDPVFRCGQPGVDIAVTHLGRRADANRGIKVSLPSNPIRACSAS